MRGLMMSDDKDDAMEPAARDDEEKSASPASEQVLPAKAHPPARTIHWLRGGVPLLIGGLVLFCIFAADKQFRWGVPVGVVATLAMVFGVLDLMGSFDDPDSAVATRVRFTAVAPWLAGMLGTLMLTLTFLGLAVGGYLPWMANAALIPAGFLGFVVTLYKTGEKLGAWGTDENGEARALHQRHGFWVVVAGTVMYLPMMGSYSLSDPWETHYGEVAREILSRHDWISTWWAQDGWFWSKPVLNFWTEALSMSLFGAGYKPDQMFSAVASGREPWPEWAIRMPVFVLTIIALYLIYKGVANVFGRRAGMLGALVLATMPHWFLIGHQTMTDMPFVAAMTSAMGLLLLSLHTDPTKEVKVYEVDLGFTRLRLSAFHLVFGAVMACRLARW